MPKRIDLTGKVFGELTVLKYAGNGRWTCRCSCGKVYDVDGNSLRGGRTKSCGHNQFKDLTATVVGDWEVIEYLGGSQYRCKCKVCGKEKEFNTYRIKSKNVGKCNHKVINVGDKFGYWTVLKPGGSESLCRCSCGTEKMVKNYDLTSGKSKSCGHGNNAFKDLTGQTFGELTALKYVGSLMWHCRCSCGKELDVASYALRSGNTRSCGHKKREYNIETRIRHNEKDHSNRNDWQIKTINNKALLEKYIRSFGEKPTFLRVANGLGVTYATAAQRIKRFGLVDLIEVDASRSEAENDLYKYIESLTSEQAIANDRSVLGNYELDIYIPDKKLAVEFNGNYWHCDKLKNMYYHYNKSMAARKKGIRLIHIFEYEWMDPNKQIKIKKYLKDVIGGTQVTYARNFDIVKIESKSAKKYLNEWHLQGYTNADVSYALVYNNEPYCIMTFGKPRFDANCEWELIRLCTRTGYSIVGGASRLFKTFVDEYKPKSVVSYCNIAKFDGKVYNMLGFTEQSVKPTPGYVWVNQYNELLSRYQTQKAKLVKMYPDKNDCTEKEIMESLGYNRVYDCGNLKFIWNENN